MKVQPISNMGHIADMVAEGVIDYVTGKYLGAPVGHLRTECDQALSRSEVPCPQCGKMVKRIGLRDHVRDMHPPRKKVECSICGKKVKKVGLHDHVRDVHLRDGWMIVGKKES